MKIRIKRIYEAYDDQDGYRVLVDRLWPRGVSRENASIDLWLKEAGPSTALRQWFGHEPQKWNDFLERYKNELVQSEAYEELKSVINKHKVVTLLYAARDKTHNNAAALAAFLKNKQGL